MLLFFWQKIRSNLKNFILTKKVFILLIVSLLIIIYLAIIIVTTTITNVVEVSISIGCHSPLPTLQSH